MSIWLAVFVICVLAYTVTALISDAWFWKLPNWLTVPAFALGLLFHATLGLVDRGGRGLVEQLGFSLGGFATGFAILLVMWLMGFGGGGDVKFMGALGAWLGPMTTLFVFIVSAVIAATLVFVFMVKRFLTRGMRRAIEDARLHKTGKNVSGKPKKQQNLVRYGVAAAVATWIVVGAMLTAPAKTQARYWQPRGASPPTETALIVEENKP